MYQTTHPLMVDALRESLQADNFNPAPLGSILPLISQMGRPHSKIEGKHYMDGKIAGSILAMSDFRGFNEKTERMETKVTLVVDDGTGIVQAKFAAEDVFSAGREDKGVKMLFDMKEKNADVVLLEGSLTQGSYESEGAIMYVNKIGSANPDIYLPVDDAELNAVEEVSVAYISPKQLNFLKSLLKRKNVAEQDILDEYGVSKLEELELSIGSDLIGKYSSK
jgi:hypothetical protein